MHNENSNDRTKRIMIRTTWLFFANTNIISTEGKTTTNKSCSTETQHKSTIRKYNRQQTRNTYFICDHIQTKEIRPNIQAIKHYRHVVVQIGTSNNTTKRGMTRTAWLLLAILRYKHHIQNENNDK